MDTIGLLDAAKQQQGLTSDNQLALRLGIRRGRVSDIRAGRKPLDEAEIFMLAEMAKIDPKLAAAVAKKGREKNPAKRAYWERISAQFAAACFLLVILGSLAPPSVQAADGAHITQNFGVANVQIMRSLRRHFRRSIRRIKTTIFVLLSRNFGAVNA